MGYEHDKNAVELIGNGGEIPQDIPENQTPLPQIQANNDNQPQGQRIQSNNECENTARIINHFNCDLETREE